MGSRDRKVERIQKDLDNLDIDKTSKDEYDKSNIGELSLTKNDQVQKQQDEASTTDNS